MRRWSGRLGFVVAVSILTSGIAAKADTILNYSLTSISGTEIITFSLPQHSPTYTGPVEFGFDNIPVTDNGATSNLTVEFLNLAGGGGVWIFGSLGKQLLNEGGPELYTGSTEIPTLSLVSNLPLSQCCYVYNPNFILNVSAAPEPSSALLFLVGGAFVATLCVKVRVTL